MLEDILSPRGPSLYGIGPTLSTDCVHSSCVNMMKNRIDKCLIRTGYT